MKIERTAARTNSTSKKSAVPDIKEVLMTNFKEPQEIHGHARLKAYELYLKSNGTAGDELEDWLTV